VTLAAVLLAVLMTSGPLPDHWEADYAGTIGSSRVRMNLWRNGTRVEGYYLYESRYVTIDLAGTIDKDRKLRLTEKGRQGRSKEVFSGQLEEDRFEGNWSPRGQGKKRKFSLLHQESAWTAPASWRRFEREGCPVTFLFPGKWRPHDREGATVLDEITNVYDDGLSITWGRSPAVPEPYELRGDRWYLNGENGPAPATDSLHVSGLRVSRDDRPCRMYSARGYQGLGDCACALVRIGDSWVVLDSQGQRYAPALDLILSTLQPAAGR